MSKAGSGQPSANRITLLRDADGDGIAETRSVFLSGLHSPFGMALIGDDFYVADTDALLRFPLSSPGATKIRGTGTKVADLPAGPINHHWTKNVIASRDGTQALCHGRLEQQRARERHRQASRIVPASSRSIPRPAASASSRAACAIANGMALAAGDAARSGPPSTSATSSATISCPTTSPRCATALSTAGRTAITASTSTRAHEPQRPDLVARAIVPDYAVGSHTASLGLTFYEGDALPAHYRGGAFVGQHGSWNRKPFSGYRVIFVPFAGGTATGKPEEILTGFVDAQGRGAGPAGRRCGRQSAVRCSSPTTSATMSGASPQRAALCRPNDRTATAPSDSLRDRSPRAAIGKRRQSRAARRARTLSARRPAARRRSPHRR